MEGSKLMFSFYTVFDSSELMIKTLQKSLELFRLNFLLEPKTAIFSGKNNVHHIKGFDDSIITSCNYLGLYLRSENEEYKISTNYYEGVKYELNLGFVFYTSFIQDCLSNEKIITFFKQQIVLLTQLNSANVHDVRSSGGLVYELYESFDFTGNNSDFTGFRWLNYLSPEEMALNGGKALYDLPYLTKAEQLGEGIFIQVGETPNDARTEEGQQQLFKATEAWWEMMQKKGG